MSSVHCEADTIRDHLHHTLAFLRVYQNTVTNTNDETLQKYFREILNEVHEKGVEMIHMRRRAGPYDKEAMAVLEDLRKPDAPVNESNLVKLNYFVKTIVRHLTLVEGEWRDIVERYVDLDEALITEGRNDDPPVNSGVWGLVVWLVMWYIHPRVIRHTFRMSVVLMSLVFIWMECSLPFDVNASPLGTIIQSDAVRNSPLALQLFSVVPIMYLSICTYFPLFNVRISKFYYRQNSQHSGSSLRITRHDLLPICPMSPPVLINSHCHCLFSFLSSWCSSLS